MLVCECVVLLLFCDLLTDLCMLVWGAISGSTGGLGGFVWFSSVWVVLVVCGVASCFG